MSKAWEWEPLERNSTFLMVAGSYRWRALSTRCRANKQVSLKSKLPPAVLSFTFFMNQTMTYIIDSHRPTLSCHMKRLIGCDEKAWIRELLGETPRFWPPDHCQSASHSMSTSHLALKTLGVLHGWIIISAYPSRRKLDANPGREIMN